MAAIIAASCQAGRVELDSPPRFCLIIAGFLSRDVRFAEVNAVSLLG